MEVLFNLIKTKESFTAQIEEFVSSENKLLELSTMEIVETFDAISKYWVSRNCNIRHILAKEGMGFLVPWLSKKNIKKLLDQNFENVECLDEPQFSDESSYFLFGRPLGVSVHWIAGNVPVLGVISVFQTLLTKNKSIVKLPSSYKDILPIMLNDLIDNDFFSRKVSKNLLFLLEQVLLVYVDRDDIQIQKELSMLADIRVCWGGMEAVDAVVGLPKKINCRDLIFGPKVSLAFASSKRISSESSLVEMSENITNDIFTFNQTGCNAPHNLIIESGSNYSLNEIIVYLEEAFDKKSKKNPQIIEPIDTFNILVKEFIYNSTEGQLAKVNKNREWNIFVNLEDKLKIEDPLFSRSLFISEVDSVNALKKVLPSNVQSMGLFITDDEKLEIIKHLSNHGVDRFPDLGNMSLYQNPWDGYLPMQSMVKWISSN